ncbi:MAG TPA: SDR family oxidoreductase [Candidatus Acidoferrum sp.]|nr:SDR family oxidoreductase [Candidatus Acidoferrum sp.]
MIRDSALAGKSVLLTGATGLIGGELLRRLLSLGPAGPRSLYCLVRAQAMDSNRQTLIRRLGVSDRPELCDRLFPIVGDLRDRSLGISMSVAALLRQQVDIVIHCAAVTSFNRTRACEEVNVGGLTHLLNLIATFDRPPLFVFVSSAAACGKRQGECLDEDDYPRAADDHYVHYSKTKAVAEALLREQTATREWLIVRPTIVLPDNVPDQHLARGLIWSLALMRDISCLPIRSSARIDAVPLSFVGECIVRLIARPDRKHNCYHISSGEPQAAIWRDVLALISDVYGRDLRCCEPSEWPSRKKALTLHERRLAGLVACYLPFINQDVVFANDRLTEALGAEIPPCPHYASYLPQLLKRMSFEDALVGSRDP